ncbi:hypothetical protein Avbf_15614 [Armadillidium vulgare]|nr:hypothetical protein Avbf_15614 [Armadillidium vulgare]
MLDFYGTFRGKCKECSCIEYVTENNSIKCAYCDHSPSKHEIKPESSSNETCDEEAVFQNISVSPVSVPTDIDLPSTSFCETQRDKIENSIEEPVAEKFSVHDDGDRAATPGKQTMKEILFSKFKLPTFSSQVMPYLNGDDLGGTERKTIFNLLVNEIIYYLDNENLLMSSNRNVQGIGYSQLQNKLLETYPKMLKEPHNLLRKHRSKGPLSVLTTTISDRRRKRRERLRRSNYNFDLSKEEILEILKNRSLNDWKISDLLHALKETFSSRRDLAINEDEDNHPEYLHHPQALVQEVELIMKKNISDMCECLKTLCRKLKKEVSMNHLMDLVQYLGPDSDCLFIK